MLAGLVFFVLYRDFPRKGKPMPLMSLAVVRMFTNDLSLALTTLWGALFYSLSFIMPAYFVLFLI